MTRSRLRRCTALAVLVLALASCSGTEGGDDTTADGPVAQDPMPSPDEPTDGDVTTSATPGTEGDDDRPANEDALAFTGVDLDGEPVDARVHAGGDVVLWMWAPW